MNTTGKIVEIRTATGRCIARQVRMACSFRSRCVGLLSQRRMLHDEGLLLIPGGSVHTLGMSFPIDAVFLNQQMRILGVAEDIRPWRIQVAPKGTGRVLELAAGRAAATQLAAGMYLIVERSQLDPGEQPTIKLPRLSCERQPIRFSLRLPLENRCGPAVTEPCLKTQKPDALSARTRLSRSDEAER